VDSPSSDLGLIQVLLDELEKHTLPRALELKDMVDRGEPLNDFDEAFLEHALEIAGKTDAVMARHAEYQALAASISHLCREITEKALDNAKRS
jgi:hypothetical protein